MKTTVKILVVVAILAALVAGVYTKLWNMRQSKEQLRETTKAVRKEFRAAPMGESAARLRKLTDEHLFTVQEKKEFPFISVSFEPRITYDNIGLLAEEAFIRLAGVTNMAAKAETDKSIKEMIGFSGYLLGLGKLSEVAKNSLCERRLDGYFLIGDYDGAVALLEKGIGGRTPEWCRSTVAKLRAHKAMEAKQYKEAIEQLKIFIDYMLSDVMKDFEDSDPANGVVYSREWVAAKNYMRCATLAGEDGDEKGKADFTAKAKPLYEVAREKVKDDKVSLDELLKEMKAYGL
jgi:hypothetical protein